MPPEGARVARAPVGTTPEDHCREAGIRADRRREARAAPRRAGPVRAPPAIGTLLRRLQVHGDHIVSVFASTHGVHHTDLSALIHIMDAEAQGAPLTASELQDRLNLTSGATTAVIDDLITSEIARRGAEVLDAFTPEEVDVVIRFLELLTDAYEQHGTTLAKSP